MRTVSGHRGGDPGRSRTALAKAMQHRAPQHGFSLIELLVVVSITLVIAAMSVPTIINSIADVKLRGSANSVASLLQQTRLRAVHDNTFISLRTTTTGNLQEAYVDTNGNSALDAGEPVVGLSGTTQFATTGAPTFPSALLGGAGTTPTVTTTIPFNSRGLPCTVSGSRCDSATQPFLLYLTDLRPLNGWAAVSVSVSGRTKVWFYNGTTWE
jgi:prepilin-type N-terminal cleavage/methylation domain-containing protein